MRQAKLVHDLVLAALTPAQSPADRGPAEDKAHPQGRRATRERRIAAPAGRDTRASVEVREEIEAYGTSVEHRLKGAQAERLGERSYPQALSTLGTNDSRVILAVPGRQAAAGLG